MLLLFQLLCIEYYLCAQSCAKHILQIIFFHQPDDPVRYRHLYEPCFTQEKTEVQRY